MTVSVLTYWGVPNYGAYAKAYALNAVLRQLGHKTEHIGKGTVECWIDRIPLLMNNYYLNIKIMDKTGRLTIDWWPGNTRPTILSFNILPNQISAAKGQYT